jgi:DNA gyrase/topoisomerase IV subunit B
MRRGVGRGSCSRVRRNAGRLRRGHIYIAQPPLYKVKAGDPSKTQKLSTTLDFASSTGEATNGRDSQNRFGFGR